MSRAKEKGGVSGINIMVAIARDYEESVRAAIDAKADVIISGGGLPLALPGIKAAGRDRARSDCLFGPRAHPYL